MRPLIRRCPAAVALGAAIRAARRMRRLRQEDLAVACGVTVQAVSRWETGRSAPAVVHLPAVCRALGVSADQLLGIGDGT